METFKIEIMRVRSNVNAQGYHSNHYVLKLPRNIEKLLFHCSASIASLVQISHSTVRPELSRPRVRIFPISSRLKLDQCVYIYKYTYI